MLLHILLALRIGCSEILCSALLDLSNTGLQVNNPMSVNVAAVLKLQGKTMSHATSELMTPAMFHHHNP
jgi:hypothetical protein